MARAVEADWVRARAALAALKGDPARKGQADALGAVSQRLDALAAVLDGADGDPSPDAQTGYELASAALNAALAAGP